jgi:hypothetical protein
MSANHSALPRIPTLRLSMGCTNSVQMAEKSFGNRNTAIKCVTSCFEPSSLPRDQHPCISHCIMVSDLVAAPHHEQLLLDKYHESQQRPTASILLNKSHSNAGKGVPKDFFHQYLPSAPLHNRIPSESTIQPPSLLP